MLPAGRLCTGPGEPGRKAPPGTHPLLLVTSRGFPCGGLAVLSAEGSAGRQSSLETEVPAQDWLPSLSDKVAKPLFLTPFPTPEGLPIERPMEVDHGVIHADLWIRRERQNENTRSLFYGVWSGARFQRLDCAPTQEEARRRSCPQAAGVPVRWRQRWACPTLCGSRVTAVVSRL